jgi:hypothetical protein
MRADGNVGSFHLHQDRNNSLPAGVLRQLSALRSSETCGLSRTMRTEGLFSLDLLSELEYLIHGQFRFCFVPLNAIYFDVVILPKQGQMGTI